ncbi:phosphatidylinositol-3,4,5-trisphosphate binding [Balamuthia mandrillaris]
MLAASTAEQMHMWVSGIRGSNSFLLAQSSLASPRVASTNGKEDQRKQCEAEKHKQTEADDVEDSAKSATVDKANETESKESKGEEDKEKYKPLPPSTTKLATSSGATKPVTIDSFRREGHLYKKGNSVRPWRLCWFTMTRTELNFYDNRMDSSPKGSINLLTCSVLPGASDVNTSNQARKKDKPFSFSIIAPDRTYVVAAESEMERAEWIRALRGANEILLQGLELESPRSPLALNSSSSSQGIGEIVLSGLLKKQGKSIRKDWKSRWCVLTREFFYYYKSKNDVEPKGTINLLLCSATPSRHGHFGFDVTIPARVYYFRASDGMEMTNWINSIRDMGEALLNELPAERRDTLNLTRILAKDSEEEEENSAVAEIMTLAQLPTNKQCADCGEEEPRWVSINIGIFLCIMCSGIHRSLGVHISKVRSVDLDAWESRTVEFMREMGNEKSNQIFEYFVPPQYEAKRPKPADSRAKKEEWIRLKYVEKAFLKDSPLAHSLPVEVPPQSVEEEENNSTTASLPPDGVDLETAAGGGGETTTKRVYWEGYLTKQGNSIKSWKTRWFVLRDYLLYYFKTLGDFQPAGMIDLGYATVRRTQTKKQYSFEIITPQRIYPIYASNKRNLDEWMEKLQQAITLFYDVPRQEHALDGSGGPTSIGIGSGGAADGAESQEALLSNCLDALSKSAKKNKKAGMEKQRSRRSLDKVKRREVSQHFDKQQHRKGHTRQKSHDGSFINWASEVIKPVKKQQSAEQLFSKAGVEGGGAAIKRKQKESSSPTTEETHSPAVQSRSYSLVERGSDAMEFQSPLFASGGGGGGGGGDGGEMMGSGELLHPSIGGSNSGMPSTNNGSLLSAVASFRRRPVHTLTKIDDAGEGDRSRSADNIRGALLQEIQRQKRAADY